MPGYKCLGLDKPSFWVGPGSRGRFPACFAWKNLRTPKGLCCVLSREEMLYPTPALGPCLPKFPAPARSLSSGQAAVSILVSQESHWLPSKFSACFEAGGDSPVPEPPAIGATRCPAALPHSPASLATAPTGLQEGPSEERAPAGWHLSPLSPCGWASQTLCRGIWECI